MDGNVLRAFLYWAYQKRWLLIVMTLGIAMYWLPYPEAISTTGYRTFIISIMVIVLIITEPIPLPATALMIAVLEVSFRIAGPTEVAKSFMSDSVFFIMGSLMMAVAIVKQGLDTRLAMAIIRLTGNRVRNIVVGFTVITAVLSSFIGEHTVVAMMLPVGLSLVRYASTYRPTPKLTALILFSIAYGATVGSVGTPSGGARNAIMIEYWKTITESGYYLTYLQWAIMAYPIVLLNIVLTALLLTVVFKPEYKILDTAVRKLRVQVAKKGKLTGREILAMAIFMVTFLCWVFLNEKIGMGIIAIGGAVLYLSSGLIEWKEVSRDTNWGVILLFAGAISLGVQMKTSGTALWISQTMLDSTGGWMTSVAVFPYLVVIIMTTVMSNVMSSSGTVAVLGPIVLNMGGHPLYMGLACAISSAFGYFSAVAAPACMIIYSSGLVKPTDFLKAGWRLGIASVLSLLIAIFLYWPLVVRFTNFK